MHLVESPCREVLFTDIEIEHPTVAKHEFEIVFLNGEKLRSCYLSDNPVVFFLRLLHQDHDFIMRHVRRLIPISTHIPRVGDDRHGQVRDDGQPQFQSTSPAWGMTAILHELIPFQYCLSIAFADFFRSMHLPFFYIGGFSSGFVVFPCANGAGFS